MSDDPVLFLVFCGLVLAMLSAVIVEVDVPTAIVSAVMAMVFVVVALLMLLADTRRQRKARRR